jgi:hypothetical protein
MNPSNRFACKLQVHQFLLTQDNEILGHLTNQHKYIKLEQQQINAWRRQIKELKIALINFTEATLLLEFEIPRISKRIDAILILNGAIVVLEFKINAIDYDSHSINQVQDYALDLKNFHKASFALKIIPILIATNAPNKNINIELDDDRIARLSLPSPASTPPYVRFRIRRFIQT